MDNCCNSCAIGLLNNQSCICIHAYMQELHIFTSIVKEVFTGCSSDVANYQVQSLMVDVLSSALPVSPTASIKFTTNSTDLNTISELLREQTERSGLVPSESWMNKTEQLFTLTQLNHGIVDIICRYIITCLFTCLFICLFLFFVAVIIAGDAATGKSAALSTVMSALNAVKGGDGIAASNVKLIKMFPDTFENVANLFGSNSPPRGDWVDGIFTSTFRKAQMV